MLVCLHSSKTKADYDRGPAQWAVRESDATFRLVDRQSGSQSQPITRRPFFSTDLFDSVCVRLTVRPVSTCQKTTFDLKDRDFSQWFISPPHCRFDGMTEASLPPPNAEVFRAKFSSLRQLWGWRLLSAAGWTGSPSGARKRLRSAPCWSSHVW